MRHLIFVLFMLFASIIGASTRFVATPHVTTDFNPPPDTCIAPCDVSLYSVGMNQATVMWSAPSGQTAFQVALLNPAGSVLFTTQVSAANANSYTFDNLMPNTDYAAKVASICPDGEVAISAAMAFRTGIIIEDVVLLTIPPIPGGTVNVNTNGVKSLSFSWPIADSSHTIKVHVLNGSGGVESYFELELKRTPPHVLHKATSAPACETPIAYTNGVQPLGTCPTTFKFQINSVVIAGSGGVLNYTIIGLPVGFSLRMLP
jgi:Fibronectin type III domain